MAGEGCLVLNMFHMIKNVWRSPPTCIHFTKSHPLPFPSTNILNMNILSPNFCLGKKTILNVIITTIGLES